MLEITESIALSDVAYARERIVEPDLHGLGISIGDLTVNLHSIFRVDSDLNLRISSNRRVRLGRYSC